MHPASVWLAIEGYHEREYAEFQRTRLICFNIAKGWGDPKRMPNSPERYMPHPMDKKGGRKIGKSASEIRAAHEKMKADRERLLNGKNIHSTDKR